jgi:hypothetical protein
MRNWDHQLVMATLFDEECELGENKMRGMEDGRETVKEGSTMIRGHGKYYCVGSSGVPWQLGSSRLP